MKKILLSGGALLMGSAAASKLLGLLRDRLLVANFVDGQIDWVFAAFRIPDFFFFLLIGGTVNTLFLPRAAELAGADRRRFFSSFLWLVVVVFGAFCAAGAMFPDFFVKIFATGFESVDRTQIARLARWLFGSVFLLACSAVFSASQHERQRFLSVALAPIFYTGSIAAGVWLWAPTYGLPAVGWAAVAGATLHLLTNASAHFLAGRGLGFFWKKPARAWKKFTSDFAYRSANNAAFQINQSSDVWIGSFLIAGSIGAYQIGTNLAFASFTVIGLPLASATFPKLTAAKNNPAQQQKIVRDALQWIALITIPIAIVTAGGAEFWLKFLFHADGELLRLGTPVLRLIAISTPVACMIPILSRVYLANGDTRTPMIFSAISIATATATAAVLSLRVLPPATAVLGLAIGTVVANVLSATLFGHGIWKFFKK